MISRASQINGMITCKTDDGPIHLHLSVRDYFLSSVEKGSTSRIASEKTESTQIFASDFENLLDVDLIAVSRMQLSRIN